MRLGRKGSLLAACAAVLLPACLPLLGLGSAAQTVSDSGLGVRPPSGQLAALGFLGAALLLAGALLLWLDRALGRARGRFARALDALTQSEGTGYSGATRVAPGSPTPARPGSRWGARDLDRPLDPALRRRFPELARSFEALRVAQHGTEVARSAGDAAGAAGAPAGTLPTPTAGEGPAPARARPAGGRPAAASDAATPAPELAALALALDRLARQVRLLALNAASAAALAAEAASGAAPAAEARKLARHAAARARLVAGLVARVQPGRPAPGSAEPRPGPTAPDSAHALLPDLAWAAAEVERLAWAASTALSASARPASGPAGSGVGPARLDDLIAAAERLAELTGRLRAAVVRPPAAAPAARPDPLPFPARATAPDREAEPHLHQP